MESTQNLNLPELILDPLYRVLLFSNWNYELTQMCNLDCAKKDYFAMRNALIDIGLITADNMEYSAVNLTKDEFFSKWTEYTDEVKKLSYLVPRRDIIAFVHGTCHGSIKKDDSNANTWMAHNEPNSHTNIEAMLCKLG